jgi:hypothetical protein
MELISYDELMSNAGMSGFVSFLEHPAKAEGSPVKAKERNGVEGKFEPIAGIPELVTERSGKIRPAIAVEDGHSLAEQAVYEALWKASAPGEDGDRAIRVGYHRLARMTRLSWVSVKSNLRTLEKKLAIEITGSENSATREGKSYRIYSPASILERRKRAGLEWVRRTRGVELLSHPTNGSEGTKDREAAGRMD